MARQGRLHVPHGTYLVVDAFRPGCEILVADPGREHSPVEVSKFEANRLAYEQLLTYEVERWRARVHVHCWLPDQAIFLLQIRFASVECLMHGLRGSYSRFLHKQGVRGAIHAGAYGAKLVDSNEFFLDAAREVLLSSVRAGLTRDPVTYEHSSIIAYVGGRLPQFLKGTDLPGALAPFDTDKESILRRFLQDRPTPGFTPLVSRGSLRDSRVLGRGLFVQEAQWEARQVCRKIDRDPILDWVATLCRTTRGFIMRQRRTRKATQARALTAWLVTCSGVGTVAEVSRWFGCNRSTLTRGISWQLHAKSALFRDDTLEQFRETFVSGHFDRGESCNASASMPDES